MEKIENTEHRGIIRRLAKHMSDAHPDMLILRIKQMFPEYRDGSVDFDILDLIDEGQNMKGCGQCEHCTCH